MAAKNSTTTKKNTASAGSSSKNKQPTVQEMREWYAKNKSRIERYERSASIMQITDPTKSSTRTFSTFSKESLRTYMKNPLAQYKNLRGLSRYLYYRSQIYRRIINYNASMIDLNYRSVIPRIDLVKGIDQEKMLKSYYETLNILDKINLPLVMLPVYVTCWIEDVFFGCVYYDDGGMFILKLDPDYCKVTGVYGDGSLGFDMDMTYFSRKQELLEYWGEPFQSMYNAYQKDTTNGRWQPMPDESCICLKQNYDDWETPLPPYISLFDSIINVEDLKEITQVADAQSIYKLLVSKVPLLSGSDEPNDFAIDLELIIDFFNKYKEILPDYANAILSLTDVDAIEFDHDQATDVNKVENASKNILKTSGHSVLAEASGTTAVTAVIKSDEDFAISSLLPQTESWLNRFLSYQLKDAAKVKLLEVTKYTKETFKDSLIKDMNYGTPFIMTLGALNGYSEMDMIAMANVNQALGLETLFKPMATASTRSSDDSNGGRPENEVPTDESEDSETKREKNG